MSAAARRSIFFCFVVLVVVYIIFSLQHQIFNRPELLSEQQPYESVSTDEWESGNIFDSQVTCASAIQAQVTKNSSSTISCQLPVLDPFHPSMMQYVKDTAYPQCPGKQYGQLVDGKFNFTDNDIVKATYRSITRNGDFAVTFGEITPVRPNQTIPDEFFEVDFLLKNGETVKEFFLQVLRKENFLSRKATKTPGIPLNILIIGVDSLSHAGARRKLPKIYTFLKENGAYIFEGHSITGDGTTKQLTPMLTGRKFSEQYEGRAGFSNARTLDDWTWIYKQLTEHGYITGHSEDSIEFGPFHYRLKGYTKQPTDLYTRPLFERAKKFNKGRPDLCLNSKNIAWYQFNYVRSVLKTLPDKLKFFFSFNGGHGHHGINIVQKIEWDFIELLREIKAKGYLNNTLLIVMGDHGLRYGQVRKSIQGKLEERLPLYSMTFPPWFKSRYPKVAANLQTNTKRLTSWFDVYATFRHMLSYPALPSDLLHGQSLFTEVPASRTCAEAGIPDHFCPCMEWSAVATQHSHVQNAARATIEYINNLTSQKDKSRTLCASLTLTGVNYAMLERPNKHVLEFSHVGHNNWKAQFKADLKNTHAHMCRYQMQLTTAPNNAVYEATINFAQTKFRVNTRISRVNEYGRQPSCIADEFPHLRKYCFCANATKS